MISRSTSPTRPRCASHWSYVRFLTVSHVARDDVAGAMATVPGEEARGFADYLATRWHPWGTVLRRIASDDHAEMEDRLIARWAMSFKLA
ncbi:NEL-type E3 ubiquitin ligase domain-containing protein [Bradyrhizobium sp. ISRA443]|uniref:NEL-type E3 ubiquitin ligase domain-containing protein n=1 Tax=unclassified Bradyrhizobium TaxID=2631580 RepID=UPI0032AF9527